MTQQPNLPQDTAGPADALSLDSPGSRGVECAPASVEEEPVNILVVNDQEEKFLAIKTTLVGLNQNLVWAKSSDEALRRLSEDEFAVVLLDINAPGTDGFDTARIIWRKEGLEHTPIIFVTSAGGAETDANRGFSLGAVDYIPTPMMPLLLRAKVSVFVELFKVNRKLKRQAEVLRQAHEQLETRVKDRTLQLAATNEKLLTEIAERQRAEEDIRHINAALEQRVAERTSQLAAANQEMEAFTYSVAHDLQAPLRNILGYAELLQNEASPVLPPQSAHYIERIASRGKYMGQLISDLLNLSLIGKQELWRRQEDLNGIVDEVVASLKAETGARIIDWKINPLAVESCDANLMQQVFANLLSNAVKFTQSRANPVIEVGQVSVDNEIAIFVRDNGVGFDMKYAGKLFKVFQRLHSARDFEGTGVGLATVARIVRKHGGRIWAEARENEGATFYFTLRRAQGSSG